MKRLIIFPLGVPDHLVSEEEKEILTQLKEEIARTGFSDSLLDESDIISMARARHLVYAGKEGSVATDEDRLTFVYTDNDTLSNLSGAGAPS